MALAMLALCAGLAGRPIASPTHLRRDRMAPIAFLEAGLAKQRGQFLPVLQVVQAHAVAPDVQEFVLDDLVICVIVHEPIRVESI